MAKRRHPSEVSERVQNLQSLSDSLEEVFQQVEAQVAAAAECEEDVEPTITVPLVLSLRGLEQLLLDMENYHSYRVRVSQRAAENLYLFSKFVYSTALEYAINKAQDEEDKVDEDDEDDEE